MKKSFDICLNMERRKSKIQYFATIIIIVTLYIYIQHLINQGYYSEEVKSLTSETTINNIGGFNSPIGEITNMITVEQEIPVYFFKDVDELAISFATYARNNNGNIFIQIIDEQNEIVFAEKTLNVNTIRDNSFVNIPLIRKIDTEQYTTVKLIITSDSEISHAVTVYKTNYDSILNSTLEINGIEQTGDIVIKGVNNYGILTFVITFFSFIILFFIYFCCLKKNKKQIMNLISFIVLFCLFMLRVPEDSFSSYLMAEDGRVLIQGAIYDGLKTIITPRNGILWVIPKMISLICYSIFQLFDNIQLLPIIQGLVSKFCAVTGIYFFASERFQWLVKEKWSRLLICIGFVLFIPVSSFDVLTCDTSLPFILNFTVFLIGLDHLCGKRRKLSVIETLFLILQALSTAAAPFVAAIAVLIYIQCIIAQKNKKRINNKELIYETIKTGLICVATIIQVLCILYSSRANYDGNIVNRLWDCLQMIIFFPYWQNYREPILLRVSFLGWFSLIILSGTSWKISLYSIVYSYSFILLCSMATTPETFYDELSKHRYILVSYLIGIMMLSIVIYNLIRQKNLFSIVGYILLSILFSISFVTFHVNTVGKEYSDTYNNNIDLFDIQGKDNLFIPIGPWAPWRLKIPVDITANDKNAELHIVIDEINNQSANDTVILNKSSNFLLIGWLETDCKSAYNQLLLKNNGNSYLAPVKFLPNPYYIYSDTNKPKLSYRFIFEVNQNDFINNSSLEFVGIKDNGNVLHSILPMQLILDEPT